MEVGGSLTAIVNATSGRAIVLEGTTPVAMIEVKAGGEVDGPNPIPQGFHYGMWVQPADCEAVDAGEAPYLALIKTMHGSHFLSRSVLLLVDTLDPTMPMELRQRSARRLELGFRRVTKLGLEDALQKFDELLKSQIPETASTRDAPFVGKTAKIFAEAIVKWGHRPRNV